MRCSDNASYIAAFDKLNSFELHNALNVVECKDIMCPSVGVLIMNNGRNGKRFVCRSVIIARFFIYKRFNKAC